MASVIEQDPVREEEERKEMKPVVSIRVARRLAQEHYALTEPTLFARLLHLFFDRKRTKISALNSYDDKNFLFYERHVVKFYNGVESSWPAFIQAQGEAMRRLKSFGILCSEPVLSKVGKDHVNVSLPDSREASSSSRSEDAQAGTREHAMRVLTYIPGKILADVCPQTESLLLETGKLIGNVDRALEGFDHPGFHRNHMWDLKHSLRLREFVHSIQGEERRSLVSRVLDQFEEEVLPLSPELKEAVIHNDANDQNILADERGTTVVGIVDMGDMVRTWRVAEIAIAMAYIMLDKADILRDASLLLAGYCKVCPLDEVELKVLRTLISCRLACSSTMSAYSSSKDPENEYLVVTQEPGWKCLEHFVEMPQEEVFKAFLSASRGEVSGH